MIDLPYIREAVSDGSLFSVEFIKRTTGEKREMLCRTGVRAHLKGGTKKFDDKEKQLLTVYDVQKNGYRSIPLDAIIRVKIHGRVYE
jgi:hypothetical protein